ncbi:uncharacterized protein LOC124300191 [Neodiprion virginianus]|uniref:uncharacterized protein LOC124177646 n=1 Tax=Neodiprion fabricii TaxID=2872261 RepID=UPI001ED974F2|nr:uncharacterized protein LOC124177646 [Neodiprion fabricii]XP_046609918.1 uncharacterized protein LOC124300191 [Neodiprion virginianus]
MVDYELEKIVVDLYRENKWKEIVDLKDTADCFQKLRLLWVWPDFDDLNWLKNVITKKNVREIVSIGCGSGLLEWLLQKHLGIVMIGVEVDRKWWSSGYSPPLFLNTIHFIDEENDSFKILPSQALLFCYFNNGPAFLNYMNEYRGKMVIIIGPGEGRGSCTDPAPFDKKFLDLGWILESAREIRNTKDYIAVYVR